MDLLIKMLNSILITVAWSEIDNNGRHLIKKFPFNVLLIVIGLAKVLINILTELPNPMIEFIQVAIISMLTWLLERKYSGFTLITYGLTFILAKGVWLTGSTIAAIALSAFGLSGKAYMIAGVSCIPILAICQLMNRLLRGDIGLLDKRLIALISAVAWVLYSVSCELLAGPYTGEDRLIRGFALLAVVSLFVILTIFLARAVVNERKSRKLIKHIDELVHTAHRSKELIPAIAQEICLMQIDMQHGETVRLKERIAAASSEVMRLQQDMRIETQFSCLCEQNFSTTGLDILDSQLVSEQLRALKHSVNFEVIVHSPITPLIDVVISQLHIQRLIGDLYRDALAATEQSSDVKEIMLTMGMVDGNYQIRMCDTGALFPAAILHNLGAIIQSYDRKHYGYADIFEALSECAASISIEEFPPRERLFTKAVSIKFDGFARLRIKSYRAEVCDRVSDIHLIVNEARREKRV